MGPGRAQRNVPGQQRSVRDRHRGAPDVLRKGEVVESELRSVAASLDPVLGAEVRGRGLVWGLAFESPSLAEAVCGAAFERGLLAETSGPEGEVVKVMPSLVIDDADLEIGLEILTDSIRTTVGSLDRGALL